VISFYPGDTQDDENQPPKLDIKVMMLQSRTPKMYLADLNNSTKNHSIVSLELITTINKLQWLFTATEEVMHRQLIVSASHICVSGGFLK
jgi:hypothetical protein